MENILFGLLGVVYCLVMAYCLSLCWMLLQAVDWPFLKKSLVLINLAKDLISLTSLPLTFNLLRVTSRKAPHCLDY